METKKNCATQQDTMCKDTVTSTTSQVSCEINQSSVHTCDLCGRKFNSSFSLHTKVHNRITCIRERESSKALDESRTAFACSICGFVANHQNSLFRHLRKKHVAFEMRNAEDRSTFYCSRCSFKLRLFTGARY